MSALFVFGERSCSNLAGVRPRLVLVASRGLLYSSVDFAVIEGRRSLSRQKMLVDTGKSMTMYSKHLNGRAIDVMAVGDLDRDGDRDAQDKAITWDRDLYSRIAEAMYKAAHELGIQIRWGGRFKSFFDGPHFELL